MRMGARDVNASRVRQLLVSCRRDSTSRAREQPPWLCGGGRTASKRSSLGAPFDA
jgi:hypothetical protein